MTTIQDRIIKDFDKLEVNVDGNIMNLSKWLNYEQRVVVKQFLIQSIKELEEETRKETLDLIAEDQGWEESRDIYANALGLPLKYPKLMESYKKRNHIKGKIILDCQNLSITNKEKQNEI